jgi:ACS family tartrate transporter-like MFS transporter
MRSGLSALLGGLFLAASAFAPSPLVALLLLRAAAAGVWAGLGVFWSLPTCS